MLGLSLLHNKRVRVGTSVVELLSNVRLVGTSSGSKMFRLSSLTLTFIEIRVGVSPGSCLVSRLSFNRSQRGQ